jgi:Na+-transporting NADH:ubiquinone oxidoreductase subunit C
VAEETPLRTLLVAFLVCAVCSLLVAGSVVLLRPRQLANLEGERRRQLAALVAEAAGLGDLVGDGSGELEVRIVELATGEEAPSVDPSRFDPFEAAQDPERSVALAPADDLAGIGRRPRHAPVYLLRRDGRIRTVVLPVWGQGYVSTLRGYLALAGDGNTIQGLRFTEQGETPGLGAEIASREWTAQWSGKRLRDEAGELRLRVVQPPADPSAGDPAHLVDGISGATRTGAGVEGLVRFWVGPQAFGPALRRIAAESGGGSP